MTYVAPDLAAELKARLKPARLSGSSVDGRRERFGRAFDSRRQRVERPYTGSRGLAG